jgi:hypothetical protein
MHQVLYSYTTTCKSTHDLYICNLLYSCTYIISCTYMYMHVHTCNSYICALPHTYMQRLRRFLSLKTPLNELYADSALRNVMKGIVTHCNKRTHALRSGFVWKRHVRLQHDFIMNVHKYGHACKHDHRLDHKCGMYMQESALFYMHVHTCTNTCMCCFALSNFVL